MKVAILDLGTNTFHLLIAVVKKDRSFEKVFRSKVMVKLGEGAIQNKYIAEIPFRRGINALKHYAEVIARYKVQQVHAFATSGIRSATNGSAFVLAAKREAGIKIKIIPGSKEAALICYGVRQCIKMSGQKQLIMDIGGGSTEFIIADKTRIFWKKSFDIGASRLLETFKPSDPIALREIKKLETFLARVLEPLDLAMKKFPVKSLIGSSGSFDTLAEMIGWRFHKKEVLKNVTSLRFNLEEYFKLHEMLILSTTSQRMKMKGLIKMRVDMIVLSSICTSFILKKYKMEEMILSKFALKEGALWEAIQKLL